MTYSLYNQRGQKKYLTPEERRKFIAAAHEAADPAQRTLCLTLAYTGARLSEVVALTDRQIDLTNGRIVIESLKKRKTGVFRAVPVPKDLLRTLDLVHELMRKRRTARRLWDVSRTTAWRWVGEVMEAAGLSGPAATPKGLRHAFAIAALDKGMPLNMALSAHSCDSGQLLEHVKNVPGRLVSCGAAAVSKSWLNRKRCKLAKRLISAAFRTTQ